MKLILTIFLILILSSCGIDKEPAPPISNIAGGDLDLLFDSDGFRTHGGAAGGTNVNEEAFGITLNSEKRIIVAGTSVNGSGNTDMTVWAVYYDGLLDNAFNNDGIFVHHNAAGGNGNDGGTAVAVDSSDNIYVTGYSRNGAGNFDMVVWKLKPDGTLDTSFSGDGIFVHNNAAGGNVHDQGNSIKLDASGNIYVTGYSDKTAGNRDMAVWKITPAGTLDTSFSGDGIFTHDSAAGGEDDIGNSLVLDSSNNVYITGRSDAPGNIADMAIWKLTNTGSLDTGFSGDGIFTHNSAAGGNAFDTGRDITLDAVGDIYVAGYSRNIVNNNDMVVWKLSALGSLDTNFNLDGIYVFDIAQNLGFSTSDTGEAITIDDDGNILVVGSGNADIAAWRITASGTPDSTFNGDGIFFHDSAAGGFATDAGQAIFFDSDNQHIYMGGYSENSLGNFDMAVWRLD